MTKPCVRILEHPGYRQQDQPPNQAEHVITPKNQVNGIPGLEDAEWGLPGALNQNDAGDNPTRGPGAAYDAHVNRQRSWAGWSRTAQHDRSRNGIWVYGQLSTKVNPFGTSPFFNGVKDENEEFTSLRWWRAQSTTIGTRGKLTLDQSSLHGANDSPLKNATMTSLRQRCVAIESFTHSHWASLGSRLSGITDGKLTHNLPRELGRTSDVFAESFKVLAGLFQRPTLSTSASFPSGTTNHPQTSGFAQWGSGGSHPTSFELVDRDISLTICKPSRPMQN